MGEKSVDWTDDKNWTHDARAFRESLLGEQMLLPDRRVLAGTGHRPPRLGLGYDESGRAYLAEFVGRHLDRLKPDLVVSGGAQGFDQALTEAAHALGVPYRVAVPFEGQDAKWPPAARRKYAFLLARAERVVHVCPPGYHPGKFIARDHWMVDVATLVAAMFDGVRQGGTWETLSYAREKVVLIDNLWGDWAVPV